MSLSALRNVIRRSPDVLREIRDRGVEPETVAQVLGVTPQTVVGWLREHGIEESPGRGRPRGSCGHHGKTRILAALARQWHDGDGMTYEEIGRLLGCTRMRACQLAQIGRETERE